MKDKLPSPVAHHDFRRQEWAPGCNAWTLVDVNALSVKYEEMAAGTRDQSHRHHHANQFFYCLRGVLTIIIEDIRIEVAKQQGVFVRCGTAHSVANETNLPISFLVTSAPPANNDRVDLLLSRRFRQLDAAPLGHQPVHQGRCSNGIKIHATHTSGQLRDVVTLFAEGRSLC